MRLDQKEHHSIVVETGFARARHDLADRIERVGVGSAGEEQERDSAAKIGDAPRGAQVIEHRTRVRNRLPHFDSSVTRALESIDGDGGEVGPWRSGEPLFGFLPDHRGAVAIAEEL